MFIPRISVSGPVEVRIGIYAPATGQRLPLAGERAASGRIPWRRSKSGPTRRRFSWRSGKAGTTPRSGGRPWGGNGGGPAAAGLLAFRNPKRPAELWLELDQPVKALPAPQQVDAADRRRRRRHFTLPPDTLTIHRTPLTVDMLGSEETVELEIVPSESFVPAAIPALENSDRRTLGVRVFNAHFVHRSPRLSAAD